MVKLVTLQQASDYIRRDTSDDDNDLNGMIEAASGAVQNYLKNPLLVYSYALDSAGVPELDSSGEPYLEVDSSGKYIVRAEVQNAVLMLISIMYRDREGEEYINPRSGGGVERLGNMSLPRFVHWLLDPIRVPTLR